MTREEALEASIQHWRDNMMLGFDDVHVYAKHCPLCAKYSDEEGWDQYEQEVPSCFGCPVWEVTGDTECEGSPWHKAAAAYRRWQVVHKSARDIPPGMAIVYSCELLAALAFREEARKEYEFLGSLWDE